MSSHLSSADRVSFSVEDAKEILGFAPSSHPTEGEVMKAWRSKMVAVHPDRGGSHEQTVEVNVAKDILLGNRPSDDRTVRLERDPAVAKRQAELRADLAVIETNKVAATQAVETALSTLQGSFVPAWRTDFHVFLTHDLAEGLSTLHDTADEVAKTGRTAENKQTAKKVATLCTGLASTALRLGSKYNGIKKVIGTIKGQPSVALLTTLYGDAYKFAPMLTALYDESSKLMTLLNSTEGMAIPFDIVEVYGDQHQGIIGYQTDFKNFSGKDMMAAMTRVDHAVKQVVAVLDKHGLSHGFPEWRHWTIPADFQRAAEEVEKAHAHPKSASAARVVSRYLRSQS